MRKVEDIIDEFEEKFIEGFDKIGAQHLHQVLKPQRMAYMKQQVNQLLHELARHFHLSIDGKVLVEVAPNDYDPSMMCVSLLDPSRPIYQYHYDGTRGEVIGHERYHDTRALLESLLS